MKHRKGSMECGNYRLRPFIAGWIIERKIPAHRATKSGRGYSSGDLIKDRWEEVLYPGSLGWGLLKMTELAVKDDPRCAKGEKEIAELVREVTERIERAAREASELEQN